MPKKGVAIIIAGFALILAANFFSCFAIIDGCEGIDEHKLWLCPVSSELITGDYAELYECRPVYYTRQVDKMVNLRELWIESSKWDKAREEYVYLTMDDFSFLGKMPYLRELTLDFDDSSDYSTLPFMPELRELTMYASPVSALPDDFAARAPELTDLRIGWSDSVDKLKGLDKLEYLNTQINKGGNIYGIENLGALKELRLEVSADADLSPLADCPSLEKLLIAVFSGECPDLTPLAGCKGLKELTLYCSDGDIPRLDLLSGCKELERVCIRNDSLDDSVFSFIADCPRLREVSAGYYYETAGYDEENGLLIQYSGKINDTSVFAKCKDVRTLEILADEVTDYSGLLEMPSLEKLLVVVYISDLIRYENEEKLEEYRKAFREQEEIFAAKGVDAEIEYYYDRYGYYSYGK